VGYAIIGEYALRPDQDTSDGAIAKLVGRSEVVMKLGSDGDFRQIFILRTPATADRSGLSRAQSEDTASEEVQGSN
jgi:hypothetical protein